VTLSVLWFDSAGRPVGTDSEVSPVGNEWQTIRMLVTVPEAAAVARAAVSPYRQTAVRLDDLLFSDVSYAPGTANPCSPETRLLYCRVALPGFAE